MRAGLINSPQTMNTLFLMTISAVLCGLIQSASIIWIPGAVFGIFFSIANFPGKFQAGFLYTVLSSAIYFGAVRLFFNTSGNDLDYYLAGGFLAGAFGALALALLTKLIGRTSLELLHELRSTIIGGVTGSAFVHLFSLSMGGMFSNDDNLYWMFIPFAFVVWQIPVGWSLTTSIQPTFDPSNELSKNPPG